MLHKSVAFQLGDLVWAKLEGYPWWPSIVCNSPSEDAYIRKGKFTKVHVQFFDDPPSRAWVAEKCIKMFRSDDKTVPQKSDSKWQKAFKDAEKAQELSQQDRLSLVVCTAKSDTDEDQCALPEFDNTDVESDCDSKESKKRKDNEQDSEALKKRPRIMSITDSEDSDVEFKPDMHEESESESISSGVDDDCMSDRDNSSKLLIKKAKVTSKPKSVPQGSSKSEQKSVNFAPKVITDTSFKVDDKTKAKLALFQSPETLSSVTETVNGSGKTWNHLTYEFLADDQIRDANGRHKTHPDYDPKTLHVPDSFKKNLTPAMKQWWEMKSKHFDVVLFFKVGKFYELYHMDAVIGVNELNLVYMKGDHAHSGFPEIAYGRYSASLVERGYRVARIEQTETPQMMEERCKKMARATKFDRVVHREICQITSKGTRRYGFLDAQNNESQPAYLLAVAEKSFESISGCQSEYGVCFVDTSIGKFYLGQFQDDRFSSRLQTLIAHHIPVQVLHEKGGLSIKTQQILKNNLNNALVTPLFTNTEFWDSNKTLKVLIEGNYFKSDDYNLSAVWPEVLRQMLDENDALGLTSKECWSLAIRALGACTWYLSDCHLDQELLSMKHFEVYKPMDVVIPSASSSQWNSFNGRLSMVLDSSTLKNLDVLVNNCTGTLEGTLLLKLDHCCTSAGKRLLRDWICSPLCNTSSINDRLDAIEDLIDNGDITEKVKELLKKLPDLERLLSKIHAQGSRLRNKDHPDNRAIFFEELTYSKRKIMDFLAILSGFKVGVEIINLFQGLNIRSKILKQCVTITNNCDVENEGKFPDLCGALQFFDNAFDHEKAHKNGKIIPSKGVDPEYDHAVKSLKILEQKLANYLNDQCTLFGCKVTYVGTGRNRYQLEVPDRAVKNATSEHELLGQRKGFKKYWTAEIKRMLNAVLEAEDSRDATLRDIMRRIFAKFSDDYEKWINAVHCLAVLDVLLSLSFYSQCGGSTMTRPSVTLPQTETTKPFIEIRNGYHPCITNVFAGGEFIPNDMVIGMPNKDNADVSSHAGVVLITGPNMGGKSTLMRQVGLIVIIAQIGCYVPAEKCCFTPVDRIFTRLGAGDRIMMGESTFYVELSETASILNHATVHSLVLMDELGRGTSTYDGMAIAYSVVKQLTQSISCRTLFSTHYHALVDNFLRNNNCNLGHMACLVENENEDDPTQETITFLYKFIPGPCPKSYGFNAAKLAAIPEDVVRVGHKKAKEMEDTFDNCRMFRTLLQSHFPKNLSNLIGAIKLNTT